MVKEVVSIHLGQAGVNLGTPIWHLLCLEHSISPTGRIEMIDGYHKDFKCSPNGDENIGDISAFFDYDTLTKMSPRSLFLDFEPSVVDQLRCGKFKRLFVKDYMVSGTEDASSNYARGRYSLGRNMLETALNKIRLLSEACDAMQGYMIFHSAGGGTGGGFQALLAESLVDLYNKKPILDFAIYPTSQLSTLVVEPYNVVLNTSATLEKVTCEFLADNRAMHDICRDKLHVSLPSFSNINNLLAHAIGTITISQRFSGALNTDFSDFQTNLVPFPRVHFPLIAFAPLVSPSTISDEYLSVQELTRAVFDPTNRFVDCMKKNKRYIACCLLYRGSVAPNDINGVIWSLKNKKTIRFVQWSSTGIKVGINGKLPVALPDEDLAPLSREVCMLANSTEISEVWSRLNSKYKLMSDKRAFFHWYINEGMEMDEFFEAKENLLTLERDYQEIEQDLPPKEIT